MKLCFISIVLCFALSLTCNGENPGIRLTVNSRGLTFVKETLLDFLKPKLTAVRVPEFKKNEKKQGYEVYNVKINSLNLGKTSIQTRTPNVLTASIGDASASLSGSWKAWKKILFTFRFSGTASVSGSKIKISQDIILGKDKVGRPTFDIGKCTSSMGEFKVSLKGKNFIQTWIAKLVVAVLKGKIHKEVETALCSIAVKELKKKSAAITAGYATSRYLTYGTNINLGLTSSPVTSGSSSVKVAVSGRCYSKKNNPLQRIPFSAPMSSTLPSSKKMLYMSLNEYVLNTLFYSMWQDKYFDRTYNSAKLTSALGKSLKAYDIAKLVPIFLKYGSNKLQVIIRASGAPKADITTRGVSLKGNFYIYVNGETPTGKSLKGISFKVSLEIRGRPAYKNGVITASIDYLKSKVLTSTGFPKVYIDKVVQSFISKPFTDVLSKAASAGLVIPSVYGFKPANVNIATKHNMIEVGSDFTRT
ncbi:lipopolysaccharide-binding protein-like [Clavelina lepadiformis]|uniref:Lipid-binding serum glycoprotein C-terminal domain-containing protein n=1 Tax=Clavelina lepadiformis TaxID=159417 RepID=A0ABP0FTF1_CLALP